MKEYSQPIIALVLFTVIGFVSILNATHQSLKQVSSVDKTSQLAFAAIVPSETVGAGATVSPPTDLVVSMADDNTINLNWSPAGNIETSPIANYAIYFKDKILTKVLTTVASYLNTYNYRGSILPDTSYCFAVAAVDDQGIYSETTVLTCVKTPVSVVPEAPADDIVPNATNTDSNANANPNNTLDNTNNNNTNNNLNNNANNNANNNPPAPPVDTTPPQIFLSYPLSNSLVYEGHITLEASALDIVGVAGVKFYLDSQLIGFEDTSAPYITNINITPGIHTAYAIARDAAGNTAITPIVTFNVREEVTIPYVPPTLPLYYQPLTIPTFDPSSYQPPEQEVVQPKPKPRKQTYLPAKVVNNLKVNDKGQEVLLLQRSLNLLGYPLATSGPQSLGKETAKFDNTTKEAVIQYQTKYKQSGVTPTGTLDNTTIFFLNNDINHLVSEAEFVAQAPDEEEPNQGTISKVALFIGSRVDRLVNSVSNFFKLDK